MFQKTAYLMLVSCALFTGCATTVAPNQVQVTFKTEPPGALLYEGNVGWGMAPQTRIFTGEKYGTARTRPITAVWASGAKTTHYFDLRLGHGPREATFSRPVDAPGLDKDLALAAQLQQIQAQQAQAKAAENAALIQMFNATKPSTPTSTNCTTFLGNVNCTTR